MQDGEGYLLCFAYDITNAPGNSQNFVCHLSATRSINRLLLLFNWRVVFVVYRRWWWWGGGGVSAPYHARISRPIPSIATISPGFYREKHTLSTCLTCMWSCVCAFGLQRKECLFLDLGRRARPRHVHSTRTLLPCRLTLSTSHQLWIEYCGEPHLSPHLTSAHRQDGRLTLVVDHPADCDGDMEQHGRGILGHGNRQRCAGRIVQQRVAVGDLRRRSVEQWRRASTAVQDILKSEVSRNDESWGW